MNASDLYWKILYNCTNKHEINCRSYSFIIDLWNDSVNKNSVKYNEEKKHKNENCGKYKTKNIVVFLNRFLIFHCFYKKHKSITFLVYSIFL